MYSRLPLGLLLALTVFVPLDSFAAEHAHHASIADIIPFWVNFVIFSAVMFLILRRPVLAGWAKRRHSIESAVVGAKEELEAVDAKYLQAQAKLSRLSIELNQLTAEVEKDIELESKQAKEFALAGAAKIMQRAKETILAEEKAAISRIRRDIAETALRVAQEKLKTFVTPDKDKRLRDLSLERVRGLLN